MAKTKAEEKLSTLIRFCLTAGIICALRATPSCHGNFTERLFHLYPKHISTRSNSERFYSNNKARATVAWFWTCQHPANP